MSNVFWAMRIRLRILKFDPRVRRRLVPLGPIALIVMAKELRAWSGANNDKALAGLSRTVFPKMPLKTGMPICKKISWRVVMTTWCEEGLGPWALRCRTRRFGPEGKGRDAK
jgi:hypothetical protein